jgi:hypothetical protein
METQEHSTQEYGASEPNQREIKKGRGKGKRPALFNTSLRLTTEVMDYFNTYHPRSKQAKIREILTEYVNSQQQGANNGKETD